MEQAERELLRAFVNDRSSPAFEALVNRHVRLVYSVALRVAGPALAEDVTQAVFIVLARKSPTLLGARTLGGWLHRVAQDAAMDAVRRVRRRRKHEGHAAGLRSMDSGDHPDEPLDEWQFRIDRAMSLLPTADREALILRFFQDASYSEMAEALQVSEEAARKRTKRALTKMKRLLRTSMPAVIAGMLSPAIATAGTSPLASEVAGQVAGSAGLSGSAALLAARVVSLMRLRALKMTAALATALSVLLVSLVIDSAGIVQTQPDAARITPVPETPSLDNFMCAPGDPKEGNPLSNEENPPPDVLELLLRC